MKCHLVRKQTLFGSFAIGLVAALTASHGARANIVGSDFQNFNPTYSGLDFITVHSSEPLAPGIFNTGFYYNQAYNSLPFYHSVDFNIDEFRNRTSYADSIGGVDLNIGYGVSQNWDVGLNIQSIVYQDVESDSLVSSSFKKRGISEVRLNTKYRLQGDESGGIAVVTSVNVNTVKNNFFLGAGAGPTLNVELAMDRRLGKTNLAANMGYRLRHPGEPLVEGLPPMDDALIYSTAASYLFSSVDTKLVWELFGSYPTKDTQGSVDYKAQSNLETLLAVKYDNTRHLAFVAGLGTKVMDGTATPDWRFFTGINFAFDCCSSGRELPKSQESQEQREVRVQTEDLPAPDEVFVMSAVNFNTDSHAIHADAAIGYLEKLAAHLKEKGYTQLVVVGHTDSVGSDDYNLALSRRRANSVANHLINVNGLNEDLVSIRFHGEGRPVADNGNYQGRERNRRVEFEVYY